MNFNQIALVMLTSFDEVSNQETRQVVGLSACLRKPTRQNELFNAIVDAVSRRKPDQQAHNTLEHGSTEPQESDPSRPTTRILVAEDNEANQFSSQGNHPKG